MDMGQAVAAFDDQGIEKVDDLYLMDVEMFEEVRQAASAGLKKAKLKKLLLSPGLSRFCGGHGVSVGNQSGQRLAKPCCSMRTAAHNMALRGVLDRLATHGWKHCSYHKCCVERRMNLKNLEDMVMHFKTVDTNESGTLDTEEVRGTATREYPYMRARDTSS